MEYLISSLISLSLILILRFIFPIGNNKIKRLFGYTNLTDDENNDLTDENRYSLYNVISLIHYYLWLYLVVFFLATGIYQNSIPFIVISIFVFIVFPIGQRIIVMLSKAFIFKKTNLSKPVFIALVGSAALFVISLIVMILMITFGNGFFRHIEDTNGELNELNTIILSDSIDPQISSVRFGSVTRYDGASTNAPSDGLENSRDYDFVYFSSKKISGFMVLNSTLVKTGETVNLSIESDHKEGNCRLVIVDMNWTIMEYIPVGDLASYEFSATTDSVIRVILVGESANIDVTIERSIE